MKQEIATYTLIIDGRETTYKYLGNRTMKQEARTYNLIIDGRETTYRYLGSRTQS